MLLEGPVANRAGRGVVAPAALPPASGPGPRRRAVRRGLARAEGADGWTCPCVSSCPTWPCCRSRSTRPAPGRTSGARGASTGATSAAVPPMSCSPPSRRASSSRRPGCACLPPTSSTSPTGPSPRSRPPTWPSGPATSSSTRPSSPPGPTWSTSCRTLPRAGSPAAGAATSSERGSGVSPRGRLHCRSTGTAALVLEERSFRSARPQARPGAGPTLRPRRRALRAAPRMRSSRSSGAGRRSMRSVKIPSSSEPYRVAEHGEVLEVELHLAQDHLPLGPFDRAACHGGGRRARPLAEPRRSSRRRRMPALTPVTISAVRRQLARRRTCRDPSTCAGDRAGATCPNRRPGWICCSQVVGRPRGGARRPSAAAALPGYDHSPLC